MEAKEALGKMVLPSQKRPGIWRQGIMQVHVTRACDLSCHGCSQGSNLAGKPVVMKPEQFEQAIDSLQGYFGIYGCFGGNPCISPYFEDYCAILRAKVPYLQRGLWSNHPRGKGATCRVTFNPKCSNLNTHLSREAYDEFSHDWPESVPHLKGLEKDSVHGSPWVSMKDLGIPEDQRWNMIANCDINKFWSAMICVVRGQLRAFFCEIAGAQAMLHEDNMDWDGTGEPMPDTGLAVVPGWWKAKMETFEPQARLHCHSCGIPLRREGQLAIGGEREEFSRTHEFIARPKAKGRPVQMIESIGTIERRAEPSTNYLPHTTPGY